jgi:hypothetical protein
MAFFFGGGLDAVDTIGNTASALPTSNPICYDFTAIVMQDIILILYLSTYNNGACSASS